MPLLNWHARRFNRTRRDYFDARNKLDLTTEIEKLDVPKFGLFKCRILYDKQINDLGFSPYYICPIRNLQLVVDDKIDYAYKYEDRTHLKALFAQRRHCDDVLIVKNGYLSDTFYANIVLEREGELVTPVQPLLKGVRRSDLLAQKKIRTFPLRVADLKNFERIHLINAMMDLGDCVVSTEDIYVQ